MKKPRRQRATNADPVTILRAAAMAENALLLARGLAAGLKLSTGDHERLERMPPAVRAAVLAQCRPDSRYMPLLMRQNRAALERARALGKRRAELQDWHPQLALWLSEQAAFDRSPPPATIEPGSSTISNSQSQEPTKKDPSRFAEVLLPGSTPGALKILAAIADETGVSSAAIRAWADQLREALHSADRKDAAAFLRELGFEATEESLKRRPGKRRRPSAAWNRTEK